MLDVGCAGGLLVGRLRAAGFDAVGVDPEAPDRPGLVRAKVEDLPGEAEYDAAVAVMSLHHVALELVCAALARLLRPHAQLLVSEFAWDAYDERAAAWLDRHDDSERDNSVGAWQREHADLDTGDTVRTVLAEVFEIELTTPKPYLSRMLRPSSRPTRRRPSRAGACPPSVRLHAGVP